MAATSDMAPNRSHRRSSSNGTRSSRARSQAQADVHEEALQEQISRLQADLKSIAATIAGMADEKVGEARGVAKHEVKNLVQQGQQTVGELTDEFSHVQKQVKDTIRERPLTAVLGALAAGFVIALLTR